MHADIYKRVLLYLDTNVDMLDFDTTVKEDMDYYLGEGGYHFQNKLHHIIHSL